MRVEIVRVRELGTSEIARWRELQAQTPTLSSPFFTPDYVLLIASVRPDVRVAIVQADGVIKGFFALQSSFGSAGLPVGAPISDCQGIVGEPDFPFCPSALCRPLDVARFDFTHVPSDQAAFAPYVQSATASWFADLTSGGAPYFAEVKRRHRNFLYQLARVRRKLTREIEDFVFTAESRDVSHLETLLAWKTQQLADTNQPLVWRRPWVRNAMLRSLRETNPYFGGALFTLTLKGKLIAANFCLRSDTVLHGMLMAHDREYEPYSPGVQLMRCLLEWAAASGFQEVDFGVGDQLYKRQFGTHQRTTMAGWVGRPSLASLVKASQHAVRGQIERIPNPWIASLPGRIMRRLDVYRGLAAPPARPSSSLRPTQA